MIRIRNQADFSLPPKGTACLLLFPKSQSRLNSRYMCTMQALEDFKLTDLPLHILAQIVALTTKAIPCPHARFKFQVLCSSESEWQRLTPLIATCRTLRQACLLAVGGLQQFTCTPKRDQTQQLDRGFVIPRNAALSLPCLSLLTLHRVGCWEPQISLLEQVPTLNVLVVEGNSEEEDIPITKFPSSTRLRILHLLRMNRRTVERFLSFRYNTLGLLRVDTRNPPSGRIPSGIKKTVEIFSYTAAPSSMTWTDIASAPKLTKLRMTPEELHCFHASEQRLRFQQVRSLRLEPSKLGLLSWSSIKGALKGSLFPNLQRMEIYLRTNRGFYIVQPVLGTQRGEIELLRVKPITLNHLQDYSLTEGDIYDIEDFVNDYKVILDLTYAGDPGAAPYSIRPLLQLHTLHELTIDGRHIEHIDKLAAHPNLNVLKLTQCKCFHDEALRLIEDRNKLQKLCIWQCKAVNRQGEKVEIITKEFCFSTEANQDTSSAVP